MRTPAVIALLLLSIIPPVQAQQPLRAGPHLTAEALHALHGPYDGLELQLLVTGSSGAEAEKARVVTLGPDYLAVASEDGQTIIDTKLKRLLRIDREAKAFYNNSLFAPAAFVERELKKRIDLRDAILRAGVAAEKAPPNLKTFWIESDLGAEVDRDAPLALDRIDHDDGSVSVLFEGEVVASWSLSQIPLTSAQQQKLRLFMQYHLKLHPRLRRAMLAEGKLPARIRYKRFKGDRLLEESLRLALSQRRRAAYPLARDLEVRPEPRPDAAFGREVYPVMVAAAYGQQGQGPTAFPGYLAAARAAIGRGALFDAWLTLMEATLHYLPRSAFCPEGTAGGRDCIGRQVVQDVLLKDERIRELQTALALEQRSRESELMIERLGRISREGTSKAYLLDVFRGNALSQRPDLRETFALDPAALISQGIRKSPYVPSFYKDLGDHFARNLDFVRAFLCWDLGRALPQGATNESLLPITALEADLQKRFPDFF